MSSLKRLLSALALLAVMGAMVFAPEAQARPPMSRPPIVPKLSISSKTLGITYKATATGCKVTNANNVVPFADGSFLERDDVILSVGGVSTKGTTINLEDKVQLAYANGNTEIVVLDHNTGQVFSFNLPDQQ